MHPELALGSFACGCGGDQVLLVGLPISKGFRFGEISGCAGMVQSAGSPISPAVELRFSILGFLI